MKYAMKNNQRIEAVKSGNIATCRGCGSEVRAYCGPFNIWHWKHVSKANCDPWWEPETKWHRKAKDCFPEKWQEVIQYDPVTGEKHIADIKTDQGIVIEFQNSPIPLKELAQREAFYNNPIWVVNAIGFKKNLVLAGKADINISLELKIRRRFHDIFEKKIKVRWAQHYQKVNFLRDQLDFVQNTMIDSDKERSDFLSQEYSISNALKHEIERNEEKIEDTLLDIKSLELECEDNIEAEKTRIKMEEIDEYKLDWKYARKVWLESSCPIFFDIGEAYLLRFIQPDKVKKVLKIDFLNEHLPRIYHRAA